MSQPKRIWDDARAKVEEEGRCRICGRAQDLEAAHIMGRKYDRPASPGSKTLYVNPESIVPLCGSWNGSAQASCHHRVDAHELDLLGYLTQPEQVQAVMDCGSIETARRRLAPSEYR